MKRIFVILVAFLSLGINAQVKKSNKNHNKMENRILELEDKQALRELVDTFSNLSDEKKVNEQMELFTDDAEVVTINGDQTFRLKGKKEIGEAFKNYLALFHTVYHINGQHTAKITGDTATGIYYCQVVLIGDQNGKNIGNFNGVRYQDEYVKIGQKWLIKKRTSHFMYAETREITKN